MTQDKLEEITDLVIERANRLKPSEAAEWVYQRDGIQAAIVLHLAVMMALRETQMLLE